MSKHNFDEEAIKKHLELKGKIVVEPKARVLTDEDLSIYYTPGVGAVSRALAKDPSRAKELTIKSDMVAVVSDGSAVLGLGNVGPEAAMPVMEGKAMLLKQLAGINAFPICLDTQDTEQIIMTIKNIAPVFAGINLEDIAAPKCFEIERRLHDELDIPVIHDDQHATAIAVMAGLINALKVVGKDKANCKTVIIGSGAAGIGVAKLLHKWGMGDIIMIDSKGIVSSTREGLDPSKQSLLAITNKSDLSGGIQDALRGSDIVLGLSQANLLTRDDIKLMNKDSIVFAMANPTPEINPEDAIAGGAKVVATGRSDYPNQINNVLVFPGMFKGAIETSTNFVTDEIKLKAAESLAAIVDDPTQDNIIPGVFDAGVVDAIVDAFKS
ncbi:NADP-dependent malic enzyme [Patescibacteria group bacterium]|nr:NADP-dependent malic enzyme [Patescibacteria group bacterium]